MEHKHIYIVSAPLVEWLRKQDFEMPQPPIRFYPDGSLWTDDPNVLLWTHEYKIGGQMHREVCGIPRLFLEKLPGACVSCSFRPLGPFWKVGGIARHYCLLYPGSCKWLIASGGGVVMYPVSNIDPSPQEKDLRHVRVLVELRRQMTEAVAQELGNSIRQWFDKIGSKGVFGEAGVVSISPVMLYCGRDACFEVNASGSGPETLNSLYLAVLTWAMTRRRPLSLVDLAPDVKEACFGSNS